MSDIQSRVDVAFSDAVEQQLQEQREMRGLVSRVEESLVALSDGMVDLSGRLNELVEKDLPQMLSDMAADLREEMQAQMAASAAPQPDEDLIERLDVIAGRLDEVVAPDTSAADQTGTALAELHSKMQNDADAVLDALASRAEEVLTGVGAHGDSVVDTMDEAQDSLRTSLTEAFQQVQGTSLDRLEDVAVRLIALGPRLERQGAERIADLQTKFESVELALLHQVGDLKAQTSQTQATLSTSPAPGFDSDGQPGSTSSAVSQPPPAPPSAPSWVVAAQSSGHTCPHCGYIARTAPGLAAHRANCPRRHAKSD
jgi:hypothetical protein